MLQKTDPWQQVPFNKQEIGDITDMFVTEQSDNLILKAIFYTKMKLFFI